VSIPNSPVSVGDVLAGRYRTIRLLGMGAMGVVVEAEHVHLKTRVALKFLLAQKSTQAIHERFLREARAAGVLRSQHVTRVSDFGMLETGAPFMVMELLEGRDLSAVLERGTLPIADAVECVLQACEAVAEAHRAGIVHRDLKPANLFLATNADGSPCLKVLDFGVSKFTTDSVKMTVEGQIMGSPLYCSPEQLQGKLDVDARSDIWALGIILYELVAGRTPFHSENMQGLTTNILVKPPTPLKTYLPSVPPGFEAILLRCIDKDPAQRWPNVASFAAALIAYAPPRAVPYAARVASVQGVTVEPSLLAEVSTREQAMLRASQPARGVPELTAAIATTTGATSRQLSAAAPAQSHKARAAAVVVIGLLAVGLGGVGAMRWRTGNAVPAASADATAATIAPPPLVASAVVSVEPPPSLVVSPTVTPTTALSASTTATAASARVPAPSATPPGRAPTKTFAPAPAPASRPGESLFKR
jgi:tRNA A-37 threonylcarbamoyl transferase component Bud32